MAEVVKEIPVPDDLVLNVAELMSDDLKKIILRGEEMPTFSKTENATRNSEPNSETKEQAANETKSEEVEKQAKFDDWFRNQKNGGGFAEFKSWLDGLDNEKRAEAFKELQAEINFAFKNSPNKQYDFYQLKNAFEPNEVLLWKGNKAEPGMRKGETAGLETVADEVIPFSLASKPKITLKGAVDKLVSLLDNGKPIELYNEETGNYARLSKGSIGKLLSNAAVKKSENNGFTREQHYDTATHIKDLFLNARKVNEGADKYDMPDVKIIRFATDLGNNNTAYITVKETLEGNAKGKRIYSLELMDIEVLKGILGNENNPTTPALSTPIANIENTQNDFRDSHKAPSWSYEKLSDELENEGEFNLSEFLRGDQNIIPKEYFENENLAKRIFGWENANDSIGAIFEVKRKGSKTIKVYRAVPKKLKVNKLINRDWITFSKGYAENHGLSRFGEGEYKIIEQEVPIKNVWWDGNDINEWGYDDTNDIRFSLARKEKTLPSMEEARDKIPENTRKTLGKLWDWAVQGKGNENGLFNFNLNSNNLNEAVSQALGTKADIKKQVISLKSVKHIEETHGVGNERNNTQKPVTKEVFQLVPDILRNFDKVVEGTPTENGQKTIKISKQYADGKVVIADAVIDNEVLNLKTMWVKNASAVGEIHPVNARGLWSMPQVQTPETTKQTAAKADTNIENSLDSVKYSLSKKDRERIKDDPQRQIYLAVNNFLKQKAGLWGGLDEAYSRLEKKSPGAFADFVETNLLGEPEVAAYLGMDGFNFDSDKVFDIASRYARLNDFERKRNLEKVNGGEVINPKDLPAEDRMANILYSQPLELRGDGWRGKFNLNADTFVEMRKGVALWIKNKLQGKTFVNRETENEITLSNKSLIPNSALF